MILTDSELERRLADWLGDDAEIAPEAPVEAAIAFARAHPRRRMVLPFLQADPMAWQPRRRLAPVLILAALLGLLVLTVGGVVLVGSRPQATVRPTPNPAAAFRHPIVPGSAIDPALYGEWQPEDGYLVVAFYAAGSEICVTQFHTEQDCMTISDPNNDFDPNRGTFGGGIVTRSEGVLLYREIIGSPIRVPPTNQPCLGLDEQIRYQLDGSRLYLEPSGRCWLRGDAGWWRR
jgi:hypothetical protein